MQGTERNLTQRKRVNDALELLSVNVTAEDKDACAVEFDIVRSTISIYLKGRGADLDLSLKMLIFFKKRIADREYEIQKLING